MSLPRGYRRLEYIQSSGKQYINTGFKPNNNTRVVMDAELASGTGNIGLFGARVSANSNNYALAWIGSYFRSDYNTAYTQKWKVSQTARRIYDKNKETSTIDGVSQSYTNETFQVPVNLVLLANNQDGSIMWFASAKLYSCQVYDNGTLIRDFIPCQTASGEIGLWDDVNSVFYGNAGTGTFAAGPVVDPYGNDEHTLLLLHGEDLTDSSPYGVAIENINVSVSDAQSKFGDKSLYFNGTARILFPEINFSEADFTIDWWEYVTSSSSGSRFCTGYTSGYDVQGLLLGYKGTRVYAGSAKGTWNLINGVLMLSNTVNQWVHWAFVRKDNTLTAYRNGVQFASTALNGVIFISDNYPSVIGDYRQGDPNPFIGYIDEFRISNIARWTENFTPPTKPYSSSLNLPVNIGGTWKDMDSAYVNIGGTWKTVDSAYVNIGGTWKELG